MTSSTDRLPYVLIVEDEAIARTAMESLLRRSGFATRSASTGEGALTIATHELDPFISSFIALIDLDLPGMDGAEFLKRLRALHPNVRAVIMTAANTEFVHKMVGDSVRLLRKPLDFNQVLKVLEGAV